MSEKVLVTGGTGTISSGLVEECVQCGYDTYAITRGNMKYREVDGVHYIYSDVNDTNKILNQLKGMRFKAVFECLAYTVPQLINSLQLYADKCEQYFFISSTAVYNRKDGIISEDDEKNLLSWSYSKDKIACEEYLKFYSEKSGLNYTIIRPSVTYGNYRIPFPVTSRANQWSLIQRIVDGDPVLSIKIPKLSYSIIHISDFSRAVVKLIGNEKAINQDFHIADAKCEYDWDEVIYAIAKALSKEAEIVHVPLPVFKTTFARSYDELRWNKSEDLRLDDTKLKSATGFEARMPLEEGISLMVANLRVEYEKYNTSLDMSWNRCCDHTIMAGYSLGMVDESEAEIVQKYMSKLKNTTYFD
ncbi:NAD-dependent epimerase/dehydratase family protein [Butyrivibrio proteoclasticus]|uniref:NAD-dependent epimerase/dehydratase family protein n=1 Tax=Butyrivibrio proteoclasticus TaxID=43305 RepID=UPI00047E7430|nr:NAD-dependent epimerase/dehydratase family protein [Butyrivibrio proteoclasticus]